MFCDPTEKVSARALWLISALLVCLTENVEARFVFKAAAAAVGPSPDPSRDWSKRAIVKEETAETRLRPRRNPRLCPNYATQRAGGGESHPEREEGQVSALHRVLPLADVEITLRKAHEEGSP